MSAVAPQSEWAPKAFVATLPGNWADVVESKGVHTLFGTGYDAEHHCTYVLVWADNLGLVKPIINHVYNTSAVNVVPRQHFTRGR